jgi:hypothetical protein
MVIEKGVPAASGFFVSGWEAVETSVFSTTGAPLLLQAPQTIVTTAITQCIFFRNKLIRESSLRHRAG